MLNDPGRRDPGPGEIVADRYFPQFPGRGADHIIRSYRIVQAGPEVEIGVVHCNIGIGRIFSTASIDDGIREYETLTTGQRRGIPVAGEVHARTDRVEDLVAASVIARGAEGPAL